MQHKPELWARKLCQWHPEQFGITRTAFFLETPLSANVRRADYRSRRIEFVSEKEFAVY